MTPSKRPKTFSFNCQDAAAMAAFLASQQREPDGAGITVKRRRWFWQKDFTVSAPAWRMPRLRTQIGEILAAEKR